MTTGVASHVLPAVTPSLTPALTSQGPLADHGRHAAHVLAGLDQRLQPLQHRPIGPGSVLLRLGEGGPAVAVEAGLVPG